MKVCKECNKQAYFGHKETKIPEYCSQHKLPNYIDVLNKKCKYTDCVKNPSYGKKGSKTMEYCSQHAPDDTFINLKHKRCEYKDCYTICKFGEPNTNKALFCLLHKQEHHVDVSHKKCKEKGCSSRALFGQDNREYCSKHKEVHHVDLANKRCKADGCTSNPKFAKPGTITREYCSVHKPDDYVDISHNKCESCDKNAKYGDPETKIATHCVEHKLNHYIDVVHKQCAFILDGVQCDTRVDKYKYCASHDKGKRLRKVHELRVLDFLNTLSDISNFTYNKGVKIPINCGETNIRFPDFRWQCGHYDVVLEVDENQHLTESYCQAGELSREHEIMNACGVPVYFIRFNPTSFTKNGKLQRVSFQKRCQALYQELKQVLTTNPYNLNDIHTINPLKKYLFYNC